MKEIYETPSSDLTTHSLGEETPASRWSRLFASVLDGIIVGVMMLPLLYVLGIFEEDVIKNGTTLFQDLILSTAVIVAFFIVNAKFLIANGQTNGKKLLNIRIVTVDGSALSFSKNIVPRYLVYYVPGNIPIVGQIFSLVNALFIFKSDKRCLHDHAAKTKVVCC